MSIVVENEIGLSDTLTEISEFDAIDLTLNDTEIRNKCFSPTMFRNWLEYSDDDLGEPCGNDLYHRRHTGQSRLAIPRACWYPIPLQRDGRSFATNRDLVFPRHWLSVVSGEESVRPTTIGSPWRCFGVDSLDRSLVGNLEVCHVKSLVEFHSRDWTGNRSRTWHCPSVCNRRRLVPLQLCSNRRWSRWSLNQFSYRLESVDPSGERLLSNRWREQICFRLGVERSRGVGDCRLATSRSSCLHGRPSVVDISRHSHSDGYWCLERRRPKYLRRSIPMGNVRNRLWIPLRQTHSRFDDLPRSVRSPMDSWFDNSPEIISCLFPPIEPNLARWFHRASQIVFHRDRLSLRQTWSRPWLMSVNRVRTKENVSRRAIYINDC